MPNTIYPVLQRSPAGAAVASSPAPGTPEGDWREDVVTILNLKIVLRSNDPTLAEELQLLFSNRDGIAALPPSGCLDYLVSMACNQAAQRVYQIFQNGQVVRRAMDRNALLAYLERSISNALAQHLGRRYHLIHAAALAYKGCGFLLPGLSGAGKSLTAAALTLSGFDYFSDEVAVLSDDGCLLPFPKLISLKADGWRKVSDAFPGALHAACWASTSEGGLSYLRPPGLPNNQKHPVGPQVRFILLPRFRVGARTALEPLPKTAALMLLVEQSLNLQLLGAPAMDALVRIVRASDCFTLNANHLREAGPLVAQLAQHRETTLDSDPRA